MEFFQFKLDLSGSVAIPSQLRYETRDVIKLMSAQAPDIKDCIFIRDKNRGVFNLQTTHKDSAIFLETFCLKVIHGGQTYEVPMQKRLPRTPSVWVKFWFTMEDEFATVPDEYFDDILEGAGFTVAEKTKKGRWGESNYMDGNRSARCFRGTEHLDRNQEWEDSKGNVLRWQIRYDGQPYNCFKCSVFHANGKCPKWVKMADRDKWSGQQKCYINSSSLMRLAADTKMVRVDAIPGAKVGHIANHINNDTTMFRQAEVLAIHAGANMKMGTVEETKPHLEFQAKELETIVKPLVESQKKVFLIDPVPGKLDKEDANGHLWAMVRSRMRKVSKETKSTWVSLENIPWKPEEDLEEDGVHYTKTGTHKVLSALAVKVKEATDIDIMDGMSLSDKPYDGIYRGHWKYGCYRCTRIHERGICPELPEAFLNLSNNSNNSNNNTNDSFHSITQNGNDEVDLENMASFDLNNSEGNLMIVTPPKADPTDTSNRPSRSATAPISAAVAAASAAAESSLSQLLGDNRIPTDPRVRSTSASKRGRESLDGTQSAEKNKKIKEQGKGKEHSANSHSKKSNKK